MLCLLLQPGLPAFHAVRAVSPAASKKNVAVLVEKDIKIYRLALEGLASVLKEPDYDLEKLYMMGDRNEGFRLANKISRRKPDLVVAIGTEAAAVAHEVIREIPIVFCMVLHPEEMGLVGDAICGISMNVRFEDQLEILKQFDSGIARIGVIFDPDRTGHVIAAAERTAAGSNVSLVASPARTMEEVAEALKRMEGDKAIDAFWMIFDPVLVNKLTYKIVLLFSLQQEIPLIVPVEPFVDTGALFSLSPDYGQSGRQAGELVRQILDGEASAGEIGTRYPDATRLAVNERVAKNLGLPIPEDLDVEKVY
jgi:putative ABC transport system substrate-binding protein